MAERETFGDDVEIDLVQPRRENKLSLISQKLKDHEYFNSVYDKSTDNLKMYIYYDAGDLDGMKRIKIIKVLGNLKYFAVLKKQLKTYMNVLITEL